MTDSNRRVAVPIIIEEVKFGEGDVNGDGVTDLHVLEVGHCTAWFGFPTESVASGQSVRDHVRSEGRSRP